MAMGRITFNHVYKYYKGESNPSVRDFHLVVEDGEFLVLVGPSGCGKSTTLRMLAGLEDISRGELYIDEKFMNYVSPKNRNIAMVFQNYALYPNLSAYENLALGLQLRKMTKNQIETRVNKASQILEIAHLHDRKPNQLSGGQKQRIALGRAIVREPQVFLMDEPLSNLDAKLRAQTRAEIIKLHNDLKTTFVYVTHDQVEAMTMGTRIVVMKDGVIQQVATPHEIYEYPVNKFVAGFIGSPRMNFIEGGIAFSENAYYFENKRLRFRLPEHFYPHLKSSQSKLREISMGFRPEHILLNPPEENDEMNDTSVTAEVELLEYMGADTFVYLKVGESGLIARAEPHTKVSAGDKVKVWLKVDKVHLFDQNSGDSIWKQGVVMI